MIGNIDSSDLIDSKIFSDSGECVGSIDELLIDPFTGIVRSIILEDTKGQTITLPWSAILFDKSKRNFRLSPIGTSVMNKN